MIGQTQSHKSADDGLDGSASRHVDTDGRVLPHDTVRRLGTPFEVLSSEDKGAPTVSSDMPPEPSFSQFTNRELESLIHVLIYRVDLLLSCLALCDWGDQDFSRTVEETEAILNEGTMYEVGRKMDRTIRALEGVADAARIMARYSMLAPGFTESSTRLEEALKALQDVRDQSPVSIRPDPE